MGQTKIRILTIDDSATTSLLFQEVLIESGYSVMKASSGYKAIEMLERVMPDIILLDIMMPGMDGYDFLDRIKADDNFKHIPVITISAKVLEKDMKLAFEKGAVDYITKPVDLSLMLKKIKKAVDSIGLSA